MFIYDENKIEEYLDFFNENGYLHFRSILSNADMKNIYNEYDYLFSKVVNDKIETLNGAYIVKDNYDEAIQRIPFSNTISKFYTQFIESEIYSKIKNIGFESHRIGFNENNGLVATRYNTKKGGWKQLGWHTDVGHRPYYVKNKGYYINLGIHLDTTSEKTGCLQVLAKTHNQSNIGLYTKKIAFLDLKNDLNQISIETQPGDITLHDGRLWHRVSQNSGIRRVLYITLLKGKKFERNKKSKPIRYMKFFLPIKKLLKI